MLTVAITAIAVSLGVVCLIAQFSTNRLTAVCLLLFWCSLGAAAWSAALWLLPVACVFIAYPLWNRLRGSRNGGPAGRSLERALTAESYGDRERAIREAADGGTPAAWDALILHSQGLVGNEDVEEFLCVFRSLLSGWGATVLVARWEHLPAPVRMDFLERVQDATGFERLDVLSLSRHGMQDADSAIARRAWRTYAYTVTFAVERQLADFDFVAWHAQCADDPHQELQALRSSLEKKRLAEADNQGIDVMVARYRREVFKSIPARQVCLAASKEYQVRFQNGPSFSLPAGHYNGTLTGLFDNAQDAIAKGWQLCFQWSDADGQEHRLDCAWQAGALFAEVLNSLHDDQRYWLDSAPDQILRAFALQPVVGPAVAWADDLDELHPTLGGQTLAFEEQQLLSCLIAQLPGEEGEGSELAVLVYEALDPQQDEIRPFVTVIQVEQLLLGARRDQRAEPQA